MKKLNTYDILSILVIIVFIIILLSRFDLYPVFVDIYYHMSVALSFDKAGGVVLWDFWEFAPEGRPHLYPPLLHCIMLFLSEFSGHIAAGKFISFIMFPASQVTLWIFSREIFSRKTGLYSLVVLSSSMMYFRLQNVTSAAALVLVLMPLTFYAFEKEKYTASVILLASCLYTHVGMGPTALCSFGLYSIFCREKLRKAVKVIAASLVLYIPWVIHLIANMESLAASSPPSSGQFMVFPWVLGIIGALICIRRKKEFLIPVCVLVCMIPMAFSYPGRFSGHSMLPLAMLSGITLTEADNKLTRSKRAVFVVGALLVLSLVAPTIGGQLQRGGTQQRAIQEQSMQQRPIQEQSTQQRPIQEQSMQQRTVQQQSMQQPRAPMESQRRLNITLASLLIALPGMQSDSYLTSDNLKMAEIIKRNSLENEVVFIHGGNWGCYVTSTTGRPQVFGMWQEVAADYEPDPKSASVFVVMKGGKVPRELVKIGETDRWEVFRAPEKKMVDIPDATVNKGIVYVIMMAALCGLLYDFLRK